MRKKARFEFVDKSGRVVAGGEFNYTVMYPEHVPSGVKVRLVYEEIETCRYCNKGYFYPGRYEDMCPDCYNRRA
jgi:hypothetical protein